VVCAIILYYNAICYSTFYVRLPDSPVNKNRNNILMLYVYGIYIHQYMYNVGTDYVY